MLNNYVLYIKEQKKEDKSINKLRVQEEKITFITKKCYVVYV